MYKYIVALAIFLFAANPAYACSQDTGKQIHFEWEGETYVVEAHRDVNATVTKAVTGTEFEVEIVNATTLILKQGRRTLATGSIWACTKCFIGSPGYVTWEGEESAKNAYDACIDAAG